jgi:hypothetical protein
MNRNCHRKPPCSPQLTVLIARLAAGLTGADNATKPGVTQGEIENAAGATVAGSILCRVARPFPRCRSRGLGRVRPDQRPGRRPEPDPGRVARDPRQAIPLQGSYNGAAADFIDMQVEAMVTSGVRR